MKIVVCGDSYCSADTNSPGTHFSEIIQSQGHDVVNLARGGATNAIICFQMQTAVALDAEFVIMTTTSSSRINVPLPNRKFSPSLGLRNFVYPYTADSSFGSKYTGNLNAAMWGDLPAVILDPRPDSLISIPESLQIAVKFYIAHLHSENFQKICDHWMIDYWKIQLEKAGIEFVDLKQHPAGKILYDYQGDRNKITYHTDFVTQQKFAEELINILNRKAQA